MYPETYSAFAQKYRINLRQLFFLSFLFSVSLFTFDVSPVIAQPVQEWVSRYQRTTNSPAFKNYLALDKLGNSYVCGTVFNSVTRNDIILIKYNSIGDTLWTRRYNNNNNEDYPAGLVVDSVGNAYITSTSGPGGNLNDFLTLKYSPSGALLWTRIYGYPGINEGANDLKMDKQGNNIFITGTNSNSGSAIAIKYTSNGDSLWVRTKQLTGYHYYGQNIAVDNNNNTYEAIIRVNDNNNLDDFLVTKYDSNGNELWTATHITNTGFDVLVGIAVDNGGNSFICGRHSSSAYTTIMFLQTGTEQWTRTYTNGNGDIANAIVTDNNGNCYVTGTSFGVGSNYDFLTIKYNSNGDSLWVRRYDGPGNNADAAYAIALDDSSNVYVTGGSIGSGTNYDYATIKYNTNGTQQWVVRYSNNPPGNGDDIASSIALDNQRNIFITGTSDRGGLNWDYATIKYSQPPNGIEPISNIIPGNYMLCQNYPNPFNPKTIINYQLRITSYIKLTIFDISGKHIIELVNQKQNPGAYQVDFSGNNYSSGVYFYSLFIDNNLIETKKMLLIK